MSVNLTTVNKIRRACEAVGDLVRDTRPRGPLSDIERKRVAHVGRTGKTLLRALGEMIGNDKSLLALLDEFAPAKEVAS